MAKRRKTGGRKAGVPNKTTASFRETLKTFLEGQQNEVHEAFKKLQPKEKVFAYTRLLPFITPQYSAINFSLKNMSEEDMKYLIQHLKQNREDDDDDNNND